MTVDLLGDPFAQVRSEDVRMDVYVLARWMGEPAILDPDEHDALAWLNHDELVGLKLADPRLPALLEAAVR